MQYERLAVRPHEPALVGRLARDLRLRAPTAACLAGRGVNEPEEARAFLAPRLAGLRRPVGLAGFAEAVDRVAAAVCAGERIGVFGDYDVDGVTTTALLASFLREVSLPAAAPVARVARRDAGYGFGVDDAEWLADRGCALVITGDCGTSDLAAVASARRRGVDVVVVDHHTVPSADTAHPATALVNPFRADSTFPFRGLASVGLAFYLAAAVKTRLDEAGHFARHGLARPDPRSLLDLVALGTIADLVPLRGENRILARHGLALLASSPRPGVSALLRSAGVDPSQPGGIDERTVGWKLAPRLNAPGRLGDADPSLRLLLAAADEAERCAAELEEANTTRRQLQDRVLEEALALLGADDPGPAIVVAGRGWAPGVVGIVAAKLVDRYARPAFVIAVDPATGVGRGSARTPGLPGVEPGALGCDLYRALATCAPRLQRFGGHAAAAGLTVAEAEVDGLRAALAAAVEAQAAGAPGAGAANALACDAEVALGEVDEALVDELEGLAPFGQDNGAPLLLARGARVRSSRRVGDGSHLKLELETGGQVRGAIGFGFGDRDPGTGARVDVAFRPTASVWAGRRRVELELRALVPGA